MGLDRRSVAVGTPVAGNVRPPPLKYLLGVARLSQQRFPDGRPIPWSEIAKVYGYPDDRALLADCQGWQWEAACAIVLDERYQRTVLDPFFAEVSDSQRLADAAFTVAGRPVTEEEGRRHRRPSMCLTAAVPVVRGEGAAARLSLAALTLRSATHEATPDHLRATLHAIDVAEDRSPGYVREQLARHCTASQRAPAQQRALAACDRGERLGPAGSVALSTWLHGAVGLDVRRARDAAQLAPPDPPSLDTPLPLGVHITREPHHERKHKPF